MRCQQIRKNPSENPFDHPNPRLEYLYLLGVENREKGRYWKMMSTIGHKKD